MGTISAHRDAGGKMQIWVDGKPYRGKEIASLEAQLSTCQEEVGRLKALEVGWEESIVCLKEEIRQRRKDALEYTATITRLREGIYDIKNITDDYDAPIGRLMAANSLARSLLGEVE